MAYGQLFQTRARHSFAIVGLRSSAGRGRDRIRKHPGGLRQFAMAGTGQSGLAGGNSRFSYSRGQIALDLSDENHKNETPSVRQAVIRTNSTNGRKGFYSSSHASQFEGWPVEEGRALLKEFVANATQPQLTYAHK